MAGKGWFPGFIRFCAVGASGVLVNLAVFWGALELGTPLLPASAFAFVVAASSNFLLNRLWTFGGASRHSPAGLQWAKFLGASTMGLGANLAILWALTGPAGAWYLSAQLVGIGAGTLLNYCLSRSWVFNGGTGVLPRPTMPKPGWFPELFLSLRSFQIKSVKKPKQAQSHK